MPHFPKVSQDYVVPTRNPGPETFWLLQPTLSCLVLIVYDNPGGLPQCAARTSNAAASQIECDGTPGISHPAGLMHVRNRLCALAAVSLKPAALTSAFFSADKPLVICSWPPKRCPEPLPHGASEVLFLDVAKAPTPFQKTNPSRSSSGPSPIIVGSLFAALAMDAGLLVTASWTAADWLLMMVTISASLSLEG